jgi:hypothetical protein
MQNLFVLNSNLEKDFAAAVYMFETPSLPRFLSGGVEAIL